VAAIRASTGASEDEARRQLASMNAGGRLIRPEEVADQVLRLARDDAPTGEAIVLE
jgi:NAD(P)-dependent dehydrogenase (short-subunit alcohol dehydrogenase family)